MGLLHTHSRINSSSRPEHLDPLKERWENTLETSISLNNWREGQKYDYDFGFYLFFVLFYFFKYTGKAIESNTSFLSVSVPTFLIILIFFMYFL